ncbi:hypothetical protein [Candidatus Frankia alpina]|uniref:Uncharacterized protein n=1 Tax=Candidatus Frankia alpina TaxID=2699483 RepID=A0A4S5EQ88_9ACTN|nr:hypothetical protein [Candidatus Frankia alpina]THJ74547.1 hypothetical protein E7Y31_10845 [Candidatus Frankia alpina]
MTILAVLVLLLAGIHLAQRAAHLAQAVLATLRRSVVALSVALALICGRLVLVHPEMVTGALVVLLAALAGVAGLVHLARTRGPRVA